ncbi:zingipain-1 [Galendromus occidentalis]|uniref:Zingipain-1 n=1 Tax=Galendromus occidentalis TaxID=34638 RepID=A0AAJ6QTI3_9ACAR|nr:zingipain-1 [Galendromus occidentalis]
MKPFTACVTVAALLSGVLSAPSSSDVSKWESFKSLHGKRHAPSQDAVRMAKFIQRSREIDAHNARYEAGLESFSLKLNQYSDLSPEEFAQNALGFTPSNDSLPQPHSLEVAPSLPESLDYRETGIMTPVKSQGGCGSCYAFAATGALESYILRLSTNKNVDLSEQDVVDCSYRKFMGNNMNGGCRGGHPTAVFDYYKEKDVIMEDSYEYVSGQTGTHQECKIKTPEHKFIRDRLRHKHVRPERESDLKQYLVEYGPLVIGIAADNEHKAMFKDLGDGIFDVDYTVNLQPNHVVVLAGYGSENGKDYWIIKNSWGTDWGVGGYGKIVAGKNMANIMASGIWILE